MNFQQLMSSLIVLHDQQQAMHRLISLLPSDRPEHPQKRQALIPQLVETRLSAAAPFLADAVATVVVGVVVVVRPLGICVALQKVTMFAREVGSLVLHPVALARCPA